MHAAAAASAVQPPLTCRRAGVSPDVPGNSKSWLLDALRVAVHIRRGDVVTDNWHKRILKASYFINIAQTITDVSGNIISCFSSTDSALTLLVQAL
jgi:hypothetical protein